jgi:hypothetical protein
MLCWVAGGDDIQFAYPRIPLPSEWRGNVTLREIEDAKAAIDEKKAKGSKSYKPQAAIAECFTKTFPPLGENCFYDIDRGFCTSENLGPITDICKRYCALTEYSGGELRGVDGDILDMSGSVALTTVYVTSFRSTYFGSWRHAFLFRSGGYKYRHYCTEDSTDTKLIWSLKIPYGTRDLLGTSYRQPYDRMSRLTVPQLAIYPFAILGVQTQLLSIRPDIEYQKDPGLVEYIAARDDVQFGYPILPKGLNTIS